MNRKNIRETKGPRNFKKSHANKLKIFFTRFMLYYFGIFVIVFWGYKLGIRGYTNAKALSWEEIYYTLPEISFISLSAAIMACIVFYYEERNKNK